MPKVVGIIGCGLIADTHVEAILHFAPGMAIAVCDPLPGKAELLRQKYGLKVAYTNISEMLANERPFSVHILSPPQMHVDHARQSLEAGCHVVVEKPLCFSRRAAEELFAVAEKSGRSLCVDHSLLFQPSVKKVLDALHRSPRMRVLQVNSFYGMEGAESGPNGAFMPDWKRQMIGGFIMDSLVHPITLAVALSGAPSKIQINFVKKDGQINEFLMSWESENSVVAISISIGSQPFRRQTEVMTTEGTFTIDHSSEVLVASGMGFGPRPIRKVGKNLGYAAQLVSGTLGTIWQVLHGTIKQNPGARALIREFYKHLDGKANIPVSRQNVLDTVCALEHAGSLVSDEKGSPNRLQVPHETIETLGVPLLKTLVTGASGFLGRTVCDELVRSGRRNVIALMRRGPNADRLPTSPFLEKRFVDFEHFLPEDYSALLNGVDEVIHCAHASKAKTWGDFYKQNVQTTVALFEAAAVHGCKRFIHLSSVAVYGVRNRKPNLINESTPIRDGTSGWDFYIRSKAKAELRLKELAQKGGPDLIILRPGILYGGSGERLLSRSIPVGDQRVIIELGSGKNHLPYTRVDVLARKISEIMDLVPFPAGTYNVTGVCNERSREFRDRRLRALGVNARFVSIPTWPLRILATVSEAAWFLGRRKRAPKITRYILDSATRDLKYDCTNAANAIGWDPVEASDYKDV